MAGTAGSLRDLRQRLAARLEIDFSSCTLLWGDCRVYVVIIAGDMHQKRYANTKNEEFLLIFVARSVAVGQLYHKVGQKVN